MLRTAGFVFIACCALSALSLADARKSKPSATVSPAGDFDATTTTASTTATTTTATNTTTASTTNPTTNATTTPTPTTNATTTPAHTTNATTTPAPTTNATTTPAHTTNATTTPAHTTNATTTPAHTTNATTTAPHTTNATTTAPHTTNATTTAPHTNATTTAPHTNATTTAPHTNATTTAPTTTTPASTTSAPPSPTPSVGDYNVTVDKKTCLKAQVALQIRLGNKTFNVQPNNTHANGVCGESRISFNLTFHQGFINFNFTRNMTNDTVFIDSVAFSLNYPLSRGFLAGAPYTATNASVYLFPAKVGHSYSCRSDSLYMGNDLYLDITQDKMQAFNLTKNDFGTPDPCPADQPDYRVAIAVGVILLVLIVVVVVAYLLSRRKRMAGYQSL